MGPHVPLQFVGIPAGVAAQAALERTLSGVRTNVAFQFANLEVKSETEVSTDEQVRLPKVQETSHELKAAYFYFVFILPLEQASRFRCPFYTARSHSLLPTLASPPNRIPSLA